MENRLINYWKDDKWFADSVVDNKVVTPTTSTSTATATPSTDIKDISYDRGEDEFDRTQPANTTYDPTEALQKTTGVTSPYVEGEEPKETTPSVVTPPDTGGASATGITSTDYTAQATEELSPGLDKWEQDHGVLFDQSEELKDQKIESYELQYEKEILKLDQLQEMMETMTNQRNSLIAGSAEVQSLEIEAAYKANAEALRIAKERLDATQRKVISEREQQLARKTVNEENMLAVIGGFGSMAGNKMLLDSIDAGEQAIGWIKTEFSLQDQEHSAKVVELTTAYKNDKVALEQYKQEQVQANYENLQDYIMDIMERESMADADKVKAINAAKDQYNNTTSALNKDIIDARFDLSKEIIAKSDALRQEAEDKILQEKEVEREDIEIARADLAMLAENYALNDFQSLPDNVKSKFDELEKEASLPPGFTETAIENFKAQNVGSEDMQIRFDKNAAGDLIVTGINKKTGLVEATSSVTGLGTTTSSEPVNEVEKALKVGSIGGWCGDFASRVSTGAQVGNTWAEKLNKVTHRDNPTPGDKIAIPLGVTDSGEVGVTDLVKGYGHMAVTLSFNPETGIIKSIESNKDGRQNRGEGEGIITLGEYNINDLKEQYGDNWGFIKGDLKGDYATYAEKLGVTEGPVDPYDDMFAEDTTTPAVQTGEVVETGKVETPTGEYDYESEFADY